MNRGIRQTFVLAMLLTGCWINDDFVISQESDLKKYPEIMVFVYDMDQFFGDICDIEYGTFSFSYSSKEKNPESVFRRIDQEAIGSGWERVTKEKLYGCYKTNLKRSPAQMRDDIVHVRYESDKGTIHVSWQ